MKLACRQIGSGQRIKVTGNYQRLVKTRRFSVIKRQEGIVKKCDFLSLW